MSVRNMSDADRKKTRLKYILGLIAVTLVSYYLYAYVVQFLNGTPNLSVLGDSPIESVKILYLTKAGFAMFSLAILYLSKTAIPALEYADGLFDEIVDETVIGGILVFGIIGPLYEELKYRLVPYILISMIFHFFGNVGIWHWIAVAIVVIETTSWVLAHGIRSPIIAPLGVFYGFMLWNGLLIEAFIIHALYNSTLVLVSKIT